MKRVTYDKLSWHFPDGKGCPDLATARIHFDIVMSWLEKKNLLSPEGHEVMEIGVDSDFALTSEMVTDLGNRVLATCYDDWLRGVEYGTQPSIDSLDICLVRINSER